MNRALILSAGKATRMGDAAPDGVKALVKVGGRTMIDRQAELVAERGWVPTLVTSTPVDAGVENIVVGPHAGPGHALALACQQVKVALGRPVLVVYADTLWDAGELPGIGDWIGTSTIVPSYARRWDVLSRATGKVAYRYAQPGEKVCIGLYSFRYLRTVQAAAELAVRASSGGEVGMADVLAYYHHQVPAHRINGWVDVGDAEALARANGGVHA